MSQTHHYSTQFLKVRHFPGKIDNKPLPGVFLEASFRYNRLSKQYFIWRGTSRDFVSRLPASRPKKLAPLANELVKLDSAVVSMGFLGALSSYSRFHDYSRSPCRSLLISKPTHCRQKDFVVFFRLGVEDENGQALFPSLEVFTSKIQGKTVSTILIVDHDFCQIA